MLPSIAGPASTSGVRVFGSGSQRSFTATTRRGREMSMRVTWPNPAITLRLQSWPLVGRVAGSTQFLSVLALGLGLACGVGVSGGGCRVTGVTDLPQLPHGFLRTDRGWPSAKTTRTTNRSTSGSLGTEYDLWSPTPKCWQKRSLPEATNSRWQLQLRSHFSARIAGSSSAALRYRLIAMRN